MSPTSSLRPTMWSSVRDEMSDVAPDKFQVTFASGKFSDYKWVSQTHALLKANRGP